MNQTINLSADLFLRALSWLISPQNLLVEAWLNQALLWEQP